MEEGRVLDVARAAEERPLDLVAQAVFFAQGRSPVTVSAVGEEAKRRRGMNMGAAILTDGITVSTGGAA
jgi:hypothetical protein